jgi:hypothetical protein
LEEHVTNWKILRASDEEAKSAIGQAFGKCVCYVGIKKQCGKPIACVVEFTNPGEGTQRAACCTECRRRCFGTTPKERAKVRAEASERQTLAFEPAVVNRVEPQAWKRA